MQMLIIFNFFKILSRNIAAIFNPYNIQKMATKAKYNRIRPEETKEDKPETDIIMKFSPTYGKYVTRALKLFFGEGKNFVTIKAADRLIEKALWVAEVIKRRVEGLHQIIQITEKEVVDIFEPKEEGLLRVEQKRYLTIVEVTLTKEPSSAQTKAAGYQAPIKGDKGEYLTKEKWEEQEKKFEERRNRPRDEKDDKERDQRRRGEQKSRGTRRR